MTKRKQRLIDGDRWTDPGLLRVSHPARLTGAFLWGIVDDEGRCEVRSDLIAGLIYPGDPRRTAEVIETHLLELDESGFLTLYESSGATWLELARPLKTPRAQPSDAPPPPVMRLPEHSGKFMAVGGAREWAEERVRAEGAERASAWAVWAQEQDEGRATRPPERPLLLDAPPLGCPDHPNGTYPDCGPCGTARRRHDKWLAERRYAERLARYAEQQQTYDPDEPF